MRDKVHNDGTVWFNKRTAIVLVAVMPFILTFLVVFSNIRLNKSVRDFSVINSVRGFFDAQGTSVTLIGYGLKFQDRFPVLKLYTFGPIIDFFRNNIITQYLFKYQVYHIQTAEMALHGNSFGQTLTYFVIPQGYLAGQGLGSCYIAETFKDFGYIGICVINILYGFLMTKSVEILDKNVFFSAFMFLIIKDVLYSPRSSTLSCFTSAFNIINILTILFIYLFAKILLNSRNKQKRVANGKSCYIK
jgi:oligosaccharide repeat unit polymerase